MANNAFQRKIADIAKQIPEAVKRLPGIAKVEGLQFIADNFAKEGFEKTPGSYQPWPKKKTKDSRKKTLIGEKRGGSLKRSWRQDSQAKEMQVEFTSQLPYAGVHNEGLTAGRPPGFTMPERKMIGQSEAMNQRIEKKFDKVVEDIFK
jgi:phage gpG-like protein